MRFLLAASMTICLCNCVFSQATNKLVKYWLENESFSTSICDTPENAAKLNKELLSCFKTKDAVKMLSVLNDRLGKPGVLKLQSSYINSNMPFSLCDEIAFDVLQINKSQSDIIATIIESEVARASDALLNEYPYHMKIPAASDKCKSHAMQSCRSLCKDVMVVLNDKQLELFKKHIESSHKSTQPYSVNRLIELMTERFRLVTSMNYQVLSHNQANIMCALISPTARRILEVPDQVATSISSRITNKVVIGDSIAHFRTIPTSAIKKEMSSRIQSLHHMCKRAEIELDEKVGAHASVAFQRLSRQLTGPGFVMSVQASEKYQISKEQRAQILDALKKLAKEPQPPEKGGADIFYQAILSKLSPKQRQLWLTECGDPLPPDELKSIKAEIETRLTKFIVSK